MFARPIVSFKVESRCILLATTFSCNHHTIPLLRVPGRPGSPPHTPSPVSPCRKHAPPPSVWTPRCATSPPCRSRRCKTCASRTRPSAPTTQLSGRHAAPWRSRSRRTHSFSGEEAAPSKYVLSSMHVNNHQVPTHLFLPVIL